MADCVYISVKDKLKYFARGLHPEIRIFVCLYRPGNMPEAIRLAKYLSTDVEAGESVEESKRGGREHMNTPTYGQPDLRQPEKHDGWLSSSRTSSSVWGIVDALSTGKSLGSANGSRGGGG